MKGLVASQYGLGHAAQLCRWTCNVNHGEASRNNALQGSTIKCSGFLYRTF